MVMIRPINGADSLDHDEVADHYVDDNDERRQRQHQRRTASDARGTTNDTGRRETEDKCDEDINGDRGRRQRRRR